MGERRNLNLLNGFLQRLSNRLEYHLRERHGLTGFLSLASKGPQGSLAMCLLWDAAISLAAHPCAHAIIVIATAEQDHRHIVVPADAWAFPGSCMAKSQPRGLLCSTHIMPSGLAIKEERCAMRCEETRCWGPVTPWHRYPKERLLVTHHIHYHTLHRHQASQDACLIPDKEMRAFYP